MSAYRDVIQKARSQENQQTAFTEDQKASKPEEKETGKPENQKEEVNLSVKVPKSLRRHWASEAKKQDTTLTSVITEALKAKFGEPPSP
jgi:predicted HicB family RNase H-like nuclease